MNLQTPSVADVSQNITNQLQGSLAQTIPFLPKSFLRVLAKVMAGVFILLWKYAGFTLLQLFVPYASTKEVSVNNTTIIPLVEWGRLFGIGDPLAATRAILDVEIQVTNQVGAIQPGAQLIRQSTGVVYVTTGETQLNSATVTARVRAASDQSNGGGVGIIGNLQIGDALSFASPLPNISRDVEVTAVVVTAENGETWEAYRRRVLERAQAKPNGGSYSDYRIWSRSVPGIVSAYPYTGLPGQVDVYIEASVASSGSPDGIPTGPQITAVVDAINFDVDGYPSRRPANAAVNVKPIERLAFNVEISGLTEALEGQVEEALTNYYLEREPFILGLSVLPRKDRVLETSLVGIVDQIVSANGGSVGPITQTLSGPETPSYSLSFGEKAKLGTLTFT